MVDFDKYDDELKKKRKHKISTWVHVGRMTATVDGEKGCLHFWKHTYGKKRITFASYKNGHRILAKNVQ